MAPPLPPSINASNARYCYIDIDIDNHRAKWARTAAFVAATDTRYGLSSSDIRSLGGSELARLPELLIDDHEWNQDHTLTSEHVIVKPPESGNRIVVALDWETAPLACENFATLCANGGGDRSFVPGEKKIPPAPMGDSGKPLTYRGSTIHRIVPGKFVQGGDFVFGNGSGGETVFPGKRSFKDERAGLLQKHNQRGILSMGNSGKNSNTSQFFMTFGPVPQCDGKHVVFGKIVSGMQVLDAIERVSTNSTDETPSQSITITDCGIWSPLKTPASGYWFDQPDPQSFAGQSSLFVVQCRVALVAPNAAVAKFAQALSPQYCIITHTPETAQEVQDLLQQWAVDIVLVAPACNEIRLQLTQLPENWKNRGLYIDDVVLEAKPMDAWNRIRQSHWYVAYSS